MKAVIFRFDDSEPGVGFDNRIIHDYVFQVDNFDLETIQKLPCYYKKNWFKIFMLDGLTELPVINNPEDLDNYQSFLVKCVDKSFSIPLYDFVSLTTSIPEYYIKGYSHMLEIRTFYWNEAKKQNPNLTNSAFYKASKVFYSMDSGQFYFCHRDSNNDASIDISEFDPNYRPNIYDAIGLARKKSLKNEELEVKFREYLEFLFSETRSTNASIKDLIEHYPFDFAFYNLEEYEQIALFIESFITKLYENESLKEGKRWFLIKAARTYNAYLKYINECNLYQDELACAIRNSGSTRK